MTAAAGTRERPVGGPLGLLGAFLLGLGLAARVLIPPAPVVNIVVDALPRAFLLAGAGAVLIDACFLRRAVIGLAPLVLLGLAIPGFMPATPAAIARGGDFVAAIALGTGLTILVRTAGLGPALVRHVLSLGLLAALIGLAQVGYQRDEVRDFARSTGHVITTTEKGLAFLASERASSTFLNANVFGGFLLLVLPLAAGALLDLPRRSMARRALLGIATLLVGAFVATGSFGAGLSLVIGLGVLVFVRPKLPPTAGRAARILGFAGLGVFAAAVILAIADIHPPWIGSKIATFGERLSYHRIGARLLPEMGFFGIGFENTGLLGEGVVRAREPWSAYLHNTWFQLVLEAGPFALVAIPFAVGLFRRRVGCTATATPEAGRASRAVARAFSIGAIVGAALAPLGVGIVTVLPLSVDQRLLDALVAALVVGGVPCLLARLEIGGGGLRAGSAVGLSAFFVHGFLDFDLYVPGVAAALAAMVALVPGKSGPPTLHHGLQQLLGILLLALPLGVGGMAMVFESNQLEIERVRAGQEPGKFAFNVIATDIPALETALLSWATDEGACDALLRDVPRLLRITPRLRLAEARMLRKRALSRPSVAAQAQRRIEALVVPGQLVESEILAHLSIVALRAGDQDAARRAAISSVAAARAFGFTEDVAPWLDEVRAFIEGR